MDFERRGISKFLTGSAVRSPLSESGISPSTGPGRHFVLGQGRHGSGFCGDESLGETTHCSRTTESSTTPPQLLPFVYRLQCTILFFLLFVFMASRPSVYSEDINRRVVRN